MTQGLARFHDIRNPFIEGKQKLPKTGEKDDGSR